MAGTDAAQALLDRIVGWAQAEPTVRAVVLTGSRARGAEGVDEFSDIDVELICADPDVLVTDEAWFESFGELWVCLRLAEGQDHPTRLAIYSEGKVDFSLCGPERIAGMAEGLDPLYERGYAVLVDKDGLTTGLPAPRGAVVPPTPPTSGEYLAVVEEFWFEASHIPKYLSRQELWVAKFRDWTMKQHLLRMLEWRADATGRDARHIGTHLRDWVDEQTWRELHETFGRFDAGSAWPALNATTALFGRIAREVAALLGFGYPDALEERVGAEIRRLSPP